MDGVARETLGTIVLVPSVHLAIISRKDVDVPVPVKVHRIDTYCIMCICMDGVARETLAAVVLVPSVHLAIISCEDVDVPVPVKVHRIDTHCIMSICMDVGSGVKDRVPVNERVLPDIDIAYPVGCPTRVG